MNSNNKLEQEKIDTYHYVILGFANFKIIKQKFDEYLKYYRLSYEGKINAKEVIYDVAENMLSNSGIVLSKQYEDDKVLIKVRKISYLPGAFKRPSKKFLLGEVERDDEPKDFSLHIASAIENSFTTPFTVDLDSIVKQTIPKIEINIKADKYQIICGTGYRAYIMFENVTYRDIETNRKVEKIGVTLHLPTGSKNKKENQEILSIIDRNINELALFNYSRYEIAQKLLYPKIDNQDVGVNGEEDEE